LAGRSIWIEVDFDLWNSIRKGTAGWMHVGAAGMAPPTTNLLNGKFFYGSSLLIQR
jgi:hypothetical protein